MEFMPRKSLLDEGNPLYKKLKPVVLTIACRGCKETTAKKLILAALVSILMAPFFWVIPLFSKALHAVVIATVWWFFREEIAALGVSKFVILWLALAAVYYKEIYNEVLDIVLDFAVVLTGGKVLRWVCNGYLSGDGLREHMLESEKGLGFVAGIISGSMPSNYRRQYDQLMNLYLESSEPESAALLDELLDKYSCQHD